MAAPEPDRGWPEVKVVFDDEFPWPPWWPARWRHRGFSEWWERRGGGVADGVRTATVTADDRQHKLYFRLGASDPRVIRQIMVDHDYDLRASTRYAEIADFLEGQRRRGLRPLIVDAGANIGVSSVYFSLVFDAALVVAIEPEPDNFALLQSNVAGLDVHCIRAALASEGGTARVLDPGRGAWGFRTERNIEGSVPCISVDVVYRQFERDDLFPFMVKIDIEGGEEDVFRANTEWIARTPLLVVELHDWLLPGRGTARGFLRAIAEANRDFVPLGENILSIRHDL